MKQFFIKFLVSVALCVCSQHGHAQIKRAKIPNLRQSVQFVRLSDDRVLLEKNPDELLVPASVTKLVTAAAVLSKFGTRRLFKTKFYYSGIRDKDKITGDLIIVGDGDPFIVSEKLWQLAADFNLMGIKEFGGNIVIDNSLFDDNFRDRSRMSGALASEHAYDAPVSAFGVNFNTIAIAAAPSLKPGEKALVKLDPYPINGFSIESDVLTMAEMKNSVVEAERIGNGERQSKVVVKGRMSQNASIKKVYRSVDDSVWASGESMRAFLQSAGIVVRGQVKADVLPTGAKLLYELESYDMGKIVSGLNKFSNNYIADVLVKRLGAAFPISGAADVPGSGTYANGIQVLQQFMSQEVGTKPNLTLENGSGLSIRNRLSAKHMTQLLRYMAARLQVFPEFLASLPAAGWDGTLKDRFKSAQARPVLGEIRAKTGTLSVPVTVVTLAGYLRHPKHGLVAFAMIENGIEGKPQPPIGEVRAQQDKALEEFMFKL